jgi:predicted AAA+ superfamily ATPase
MSIGSGCVAECPGPTLLDTDKLSNRWRDDYIATFLERDLAQLGFRMPAATMRRFWMTLAHYHGQTWNGAELAEHWASAKPRSAAISMRSPTHWWSDSYNRGSRTQANVK